MNVEITVKYRINDLCCEPELYDYDQHLSRKDKINRLTRNLIESEGIQGAVDNPKGYIVDIKEVI